MQGITTDEFFADAAKILTVLQSAFPQPIILQADDICGAEETDEYGMHSPRYLACFSAMLWLAEEGYLRFGETVRTEAIDQAVLSARCFVLLTKPTTFEPAAGESLTSEQFSENPEQNTSGVPVSVALDQSSLGHQLHAALRPRDSLRLKTIMLRLMTAMLKN